MSNDLYPRWFNELPTKNRPPSSDATSPYPKLAAWLLLLFLGILLFNNLWTWFSLSILADEDTMRSCLQEVAGPESTTNLADATNQEYLQEAANSALQTALAVFLLTIALVFTWLRLRKSN